MIIAGTGHRPEEIDEIGTRIRVRNKLKEAGEIESIITGMAAGFDLWFADEAIELGIPVIAAVPWKGHEPRQGDEELYTKVLDVAHTIVHVNQKQDYPGPWVYQDRNKWMVDNSTHVLAMLNPAATKGGTFNCVKYLKSLPDDTRPKLYNLWNDPPF